MKKRIVKSKRTRVSVGRPVGRKKAQPIFGGPYQELRRLTNVLFGSKKKRKGI